jgi:hypothetical protein
MNLRVPKNVGKFLSSCATGGFSRRTQLHGVSEFISDELSGIIKAAYPEDGGRGFLRTTRRHIPRDVIFTKKKHASMLR